MIIRVLLADDQALVRGAFALLVASAADMEVVGEAATGREAVSLARTGRADVVVMDIRMPDVDGIEACRQIAADDDLAGVRVLILTTFETDDNVVQAIRAGASAFLVKDTQPAQLLDAIRTVAPVDGQDPRQPDHDQAAGPRPRPIGHRSVRIRAGPRTAPAALTDPISLKGRPRLRSRLRP